MTTDDLAEQVAWAICQASAIGNGEAMFLHKKQYYMALARAAIAAIEAAGYVSIEKEIIDSVRRGDRR